ncbi:MAG TPA: HD domain-containing protein [Vicinamibacterales bacterium]|nr:HD domain-containing protein [Vicinamibacterales bacterium]
MTIGIMARLSRIADLDASASGWGFFLCARKDLRAGRNGGEFLDLLLQDVSGEIRAKVFQDVDVVRLEFDAGEFVKIQAKGNVYHGRFELIVDKIRRVMPERDAADGFREDDCIPTSPRPLDEMWSELAERLASVEHPAIRELLGRIVDRHADRLRVWPAARQIHHAYRSGLLEHILKIMTTVVHLAEQYGARQDLLIAGALLHDIGKLRELSYDITIDYSVEGNLVGHIVIGVGMVRDVIREIPDFPQDLQTEIEHLILSHHGSLELGSPVKPMTVEAFILAAADEFDARLHQVRRLLTEDDTEGPFTAYNRRLERQLYKGTLK